MTLWPLYGLRPLIRPYKVLGALYGLIWPYMALYGLNGLDFSEEEDMNTQSGMHWNHFKDLC